MSTEPNTQKSTIKRKTDIKAESQNPVAEIQRLSQLQKWKETELNQFIKYLSEYPYPKINENEKTLAKAILSIPKEYKSRVLFFIIHQDYLDFIERKEKHRFSFVSAIKPEISAFLVDLFGLQELQTKLLEKADEIDKLKDLFREKLGLNSKQISKSEIENINQVKNLDAPWESFSKLDRLRFLYALVICSNDLNLRSEAKLSPIYRVIDTLITTFLKCPNKDLEESVSYLDDREIIKYKLKILFKELREKSSETQLEAIYDFERPTLWQVQALKSSNEELQYRNRNLHTTNEQLRQHLNEVETEKQYLSSQLSDCCERIQQLEAEVKRQEDSYSRLQEASVVKLSQELNSELNQLKNKIGHEFEKLQRGIDKYVADEDIKSRFLTIMNKIENSIQVNQ